MLTAKRVTLYASSKDRALAFSKRVHGYDRAGESGEKIVLLDDIFNLIKGQPVAKRFGLKQKTKDRRPYWVFQP